LHSFRQRLGVADRREQASLPIVDDGCGAPAGSAHYRQATRHCLQDHDAESLLVRRKHEELSVPVKLGKLIALLEACHMDGIGNSQLAQQLLNLSRWQLSDQAQIGHRS
jgi:hypothetical protein